MNNFEYRVENDEIRAAGRLTDCEWEKVEWTANSIHFQKWEKAEFY